MRRVRNYFVYGRLSLCFLGYVIGRDVNIVKIKFLCEKYRITVFVYNLEKFVKDIIVK